MTDDKLRGFVYYLESIGEGNLGDSSKNSYVSYMKSLCDYILDDYVKNELVSPIGFIDLFYSLRKEKRGELLILVECYLKNFRGPDFRRVNVTQNTLNNYRSGFKWFMYMSEDYTENAQAAKRGLKTKDKKVIEEKITELYKKLPELSYSKEQLDHCYIARLRTQDREYEKIGFPIRLILMLANKFGCQSEIFAAMQERLDEMIYYVSYDDGNSIEVMKHASVKKLLLNNKTNYTYVNDRKIKLYTELYMGGESKKYGPQRPGLEKISIDHKEPLYKILNDGFREQEYPYPNLLKLHRDMQSFKFPAGATLSDKASIYFGSLQRERYDEVFVKGLVDEVCKLFARMEFEAMDKGENSRKNKRYEE